MHRSLFLFLLLAAFLPQGVQGQQSPVNRDHALLIGLGYAAQLPGGDLADRFGYHFNLNGGVDFLTQKTNWIFGLEGQFLFGPEVKEDVLARLRTPEGFIIGNDKSYADIQLRQRGFYAGGKVGKLFSLSSGNPRSAVRFTFGAGFLQHQIRIQDDPIRTVPQLSGDYKKGYDRLTNGLAFQQFIGYQLLSDNKRINFFAGLEFVQAFTQNRRDFNFDTRMRDDRRRTDLLFGLRAGWILPFYLGKGEDILY